MNDDLETFYTLEGLRSGVERETRWDKQGILPSCAILYALSLERNIELSFLSGS